MKKIFKQRIQRFGSNLARDYLCRRITPSMSRIVCIVATLNEAATIGDVVRQAKPYVHQVVVVDGFSQDETCSRARHAGSEILYQKGKGKGMALRTAFDRVEAEIYVTIDGDATYNAEEMDDLIQPILDGEADMVIGSRLRGKMERGAISRVNMLGNRLFNTLINYFFGGHITDSQSGFRAIHRRVLDSFMLSSQGFEIETELTVKAMQRGFRIREIPIWYGTRRGTPSKLSALSAGARIMTTIFSCVLINY